jgi:hypothetical protein
MRPHLKLHSLQSFKRIAFSFLSTIGLCGYAQDLIYSSANTGFVFTLNAALGTHFQRFGFNLHFFYVNGQFQANTALGAYYNLKNLGPPLQYPELVLSQGILFAYGNYHSPGFNPFLSCISNQTAYKNSAAYAYSLWFNSAKTSQQTGMIALQFGQVSVIAENDLLAKPSLDRFRTGAFMVMVQPDNHWQFAVNTTMWTGRFGYRKYIAGVPQFYNGCYMDTTGGKYTRYSHGLLALSARYYAGLAQNVQAAAGVDAEEIRNVTQNRFMHDMKFLPQKWIRHKNCHIPMVDESGNPFVYGPDQKVRKPRPFLNLASDPNLFY